MPGPVGFVLEVVFPAWAEEEDEATGVRDKGAVTARSTLEVAFSLRLAGRV